MNSINLLPKDKRLNSKAVLIRKWVMLSTTITLVVFLVAVSGLLGWWLYLAAQNNMATTAIAATQAEIRNVSSTEAVVLEVSKRVQLTEEFLAGRSDVGGIAASVIPQQNVAIESYTYTPEAKALNVSVGQLSELELYTEGLKKIFADIQNATVVSPDGVNWTASITL